MTELPDGYRILEIGEAVRKGDLWRGATGIWDDYGGIYAGEIVVAGWERCWVRKIDKPAPESTPKELVIAFRIDEATAQMFAENDPGSYESKYMKRLAAACGKAVKAKEEAIEEQRVEIDRLFALKMEAKEKWTELAKETKAARKKLQEML